MDASLGLTSGHKWIHSMYTVKRFADIFWEISVGDIKKMSKFMELRLSALQNHHHNHYS